MERLVIRVDASIQIGTGHLMRCLALAQAWKDAGGRVIFITACQDEGLLQRLREEEFSINLLSKPHPHPSDWDYTKGILASYPDAWVVLDGYHFDEVYQRQVKATEHRLLVIDDMAHLRHYYPDILLNQNIAVMEGIYSCESYTRLLLGPKYALIRQEFLRARNSFIRRFPRKAKNILVTFGGWDHKNLTLRVLQAIETLNDPETVIKVVVGELNQHIGVLRSIVAKSQSNFEILTNVGNDMPALMKWADLVITTVGITLWELCLFLVPTMVGLVSDNIVANHRKKDIASALADMGAVENLGWLAERDIQELAEDIDKCIHDPKLRKSMSGSMTRVVDGRGAERAVNVMREKDENTKNG